MGEEGRGGGKGGEGGVELRVGGSGAVGVGFGREGGWLYGPEGENPLVMVSEGILGNVELLR